MTKRDLGPEMLARLDAKLASGVITQTQYDAERVKVLELIRTGKTIDHGPARRIIVTVCSALLVVLGLGALLSMVAFGGGLGGILLKLALGLALIAAGVSGWRSVR